MNISFPEDTNNLIELFVASFEGKKVLQMNLQPDSFLNRQYVLHTANYPAGVYFVKFMSNNFVFTHKFLKQ